MIVAVSKQVSVYQKEAPFLIAALYKKLYHDLALGKGGEVSAVSKPKLTSKRYKYLQALYFIVAHGSEAIAKQLAVNNIFSIILDYIMRYQWHSLALIEIEKTIKATFHSPTEAVFTALSRSHFPDKLKELGRVHLGEGKTGCGFSGMLVHLVTVLKQSIDTETGYGGWLAKTGALGDLGSWVNEFSAKKKEGEESMRVVHEVAKPFYHISKLPEEFRQFFDEAEAINTRMQSSNPNKHVKEQNSVMEEIENENEMVYKWINMALTEGEEKKSEESL